MVYQMLRKKLLGLVVVVEMDRLFRWLVDWALLQPACQGSSDPHFFQPASLLPPLSDCLCLQVHNPDYLGRHGLHPDQTHPGLHHPDYLLGHLPLHPVYQGHPFSDILYLA
jgi:hypothetical protein